MYDHTTPAGNPCTADGFCSVELARDFNPIPLDSFDKEITSRMSSLSGSLREISDAVNAALAFSPSKGQLTVLSIFHGLMPVWGISGNHVRAHWTLVQCWLTKRAGAEILGVQPWDEYFIDGDTTEEGD